MNPHQFEMIQLSQDTKKAVEAFLKREKWGHGGTSATRCWCDGDTIFIYGHAVARRVWGERGENRSKEFFILSLCGHGTKLTLDRLNGLLQVAHGRRPFFTRKGKIYFGTLAREVDLNEKIVVPAKVEVHDNLHNEGGRPVFPEPAGQRENKPSINPALAR